MDKVYSGISPDFGYSGDEDQGLMGSLAVLMKTGIFSTNGGVSANPVYELTSPLFKRITLHLNRDYYSGGKVVIDAEGNSATNMYIQSALWNGQPLDRCWIRHDEFVKGGTLKLVMGPLPNESWASAPENAPPSMEAHD